MRLRSLAALVLLTVLATPAAATATDRGQGPLSPAEEGVLDDEQHTGPGGHLPPVQRNVTVVGKVEVTNPSGAGNDGRVADVFGYGDYAYLTAFRDPTCEQTGVHVIDISDPAKPVEVADAFIPTTDGSYAGEGVQVISMANDFFSGDLLLHNNETCPGETPTVAGGISLWDVTDPTDPEPVALHTGDFTNPTGATDPTPNQTHSMYAWNNELDGRTYVVLVDDEEETDLDILDITDPYKPVLVNDTLDLDALFGVGQEQPANLRDVFSHDMMVQRVGQRYVMNASYWDGGYVLLDVTDPRPGQVELIAESDYPLLDEERLARGQQISPEGNAHQSELSPDRRFLIGTDEDFGPYRITATITSGPYAGTEYRTTTASGTPAVDADTTVSGTPTFVGLACSPLPPGTGIALVERGTCTFQVKLDNIEAAGYSAGIVFNSLRADCVQGARMAAEGDIPFVFANRVAGLQLLGVAGVTEANACTTPTPAVGTAVASTTIEAIFDGWGYVRLFATEVPGHRGEKGSITSLDTYTVPEAQDPAFAAGFGTLSVHEVAVDPDHQIAYLSYYAAGFRVVHYSEQGLQEIGAFIDEGGNDFWGVEVWHDENGEKYVLASDRDYGLYVLRYTP